ncbi:hypothetical protein PoB_002094900 [Plakobranchus ocellatus]|uniref:Uncharacterized protein n=1 Tax=Plakobranchus ocellatus TaxID=259542 RepID=A0AAV3ZJ75_9GAST|nr:hypothetical protein PoB_002094900 [Plakobranchus ocellatus]
MKRETIGCPTVKKWRVEKKAADLCFCMENQIEPNITTGFKLDEVGAQYKLSCICKSPSKFFELPLDDRMKLVNEIDKFLALPGNCLLMDVID